MLDAGLVLPDDDIKTYKKLKKLKIDRPFEKADKSYWYAIFSGKYSERYK